MIFEWDYDTFVPNNVILMTVLYQETYNHKVPYGTGRENKILSVFTLVSYVLMNFELNYVHDNSSSREIGTWYFWIRH